MSKIRFDFQDEVAVVTGASGGIGKAIAAEFAAAGAYTVIADLKKEEGEQTVSELTADGYQAVFIETDVTSQASTDALIREVCSRYGKIDILVNGAGVAGTVFGDPFTDLVESDFVRTYNVNVLGVYHTCRSVFDLFCAQKRGKIINLASVVGHSTNPQNVPYAVSKAGVLNLTMNLAKEMGKYSVNVNAVCPGYVLTPMYEKCAPAMIKKNPSLAGKGAPELVQYFSEMNCALKRPQSPEDIAKGVVFLASDDAQNITGQILDIGGGYKI